MNTITEQFASILATAWIESRLTHGNTNIKQIKSVRTTLSEYGIDGALNFAVCNGYAERTADGYKLNKECLKFVRKMGFNA